MGVRTVRLDEETEKVLRHLRRSTGLSVSAALKRGLFALSDETNRRAGSKPYEVYRRLDLGPGGYAVAPSTETRRGMVQILNRKRGR